MSIEAIKTELTDFLNSGEAGIFAVKGKWGVGKTHLIKKIKEANQSSWKNKKYAYVSLFGVNSIEEFRVSIALEMELDNKLLGQLKGWARIGIEAGEASEHTIGGIGSYAIRRAISSNIQESKICIDDIERRGDNLAIKDLLGFISQLKEEKDCQIILVFNEDELNKDKEELDKYREKVIDYEIEFVPDASEIIKIGLEHKHPVAVEVLEKLNVDNIRAVSKIGKFLEKLKPKIQDFDLEVQKHIVHSATVLGWFYFTRNKNSIPWSFIKELEEYQKQQTQIMIDRMYNEKAVEFGNKQRTIPAKAEEDAKKDKYSNELKQYDYEQTGPIEELLIQALEQGFHNEFRLRETLTDFESKIEKDKAIKEIQDAFDILYSSFDDNESDLANTLIQCFGKNSKHYSPDSLEYATKILENLERHEDSQKIIELYFSVPHIFDKPYEYRDFPKLQNPEIKRRVKSIIEETRGVKDAVEIIKEYVVGSSFNDTIILHKLTEEDWLFLITEKLKETNDLWFNLNKILELGHREGVPREIGQKVANVLRKLALKSKINQLRVKGFQEVLKEYPEVDNLI